MRLLQIYLISINVVGLIAIYSDKRRAIDKQWRIPEKTLFLIAIMGGSIGSILGMKMYRHKTKHLSFKYGMPIILMIQIILSIFFLNK